MTKLNQTQKIKELYAEGKNLMEYLRSLDNSKANDIESILISYDFQAGSYVENANKKPEYIADYSGAIANTINKLGSFDTVMEVGVGEATILSNMVTKLSKMPSEILGFDISWSRIKYARQYSQSKNVNARLFTANLFEIPLPDNSVDIVYTSHSLEPNGGREEDALKELYRVASKYVVLLEPGYEFATEEGKARMDKHGYVKDLHGHAKKLGYNVLEHRLFDLYINPVNPTALTIIKKEDNTDIKPNLVCPVSHTELSLTRGVYFSNQSMLAFPIVDGIPCLLKENAILASHFLD